MIYKYDKNYTIQYLLLGLGISNLSIQNYFDQQKINYQTYDDENPKELSKFDVIVKSPGISNLHFILNENTKPVISDLELFYLLSNNKKMITVTGTNGKTTTCTLISKILDEYDLGGNIGIPLFNYINSSKPIIIEASSFMLEYTNKFRSKYNVILNITPNHLDHHYTFEEYIRCKAKLIDNIKCNDFLIYNYDDLVVRGLASQSKGINIPFSIKEKVEGCYYHNGYIYIDERAVINLSEMNLQGKHNIYNVLAAIMVSYLNGANIYKIRKAVKHFSTLEHRIEYIDSFKGISIYNDSKATNYQALKAALKTFSEKKVLLICGGKERTEDISLLDDVIDNVCEVRIVGENNYQLSKYFDNHKIANQCYKSLDNILDDIENIKCEVILFSPGATSFDMYRNYRERGEKFKKIVKNALKNVKN